MIRSFRGVMPRIAASAYIDAAAVVIGDVAIGELSSLWPSVTVRGDIEPIRIGAETNIQECSVVHTDKGFPTTIGDRVTIGHGAVVHGCVLEDDSLIGIGAIVLTGARVGRGAVIAAGSLVPEGAEIEAGTLAVGTPAKPKRAVTDQERERFRAGVANYVERARLYGEEARGAAK
jgi:carbonic anhydrase/acetyltransferase-like protein (isoleucine patch superfamily)